MEPPENCSNGGGDCSVSGFDAAEKVIMRWDSTASEEARDRMIFTDPHEVKLYLLAVDEIQRSASSVGAGESESRASSAIQIAMARLRDEFRNILVSHSSPIDSDSLLVDPTSSFSSAHGLDLEDEVSGNVDCNEEDHHEQEEEEESTDLLKRAGSSSGSGSGSGSVRLPTCRGSYSRSTSSIREIELIPVEAVVHLSWIARRMVAAGYLRECIQVYGSVRKSAVDSSFRRLGIEKLSIGDVQRLDWEALEQKIRRWIRAAKVCVRVVFASEKRLCEHVFDSVGAVNIHEACFMETVKGPAIQLFNFAEAISISRRSPEKLFKILDLHDALMELLPDIEAVFDLKSSDSIRVQAAEILSRLAEAARGILSEFENAVLREPSRVPVPGGTIHPLTRYVMNYISLISEYKPTLIDLIMSKPSRNPSDSNSPEFDFSELDHKSPLALHLIWIIVILQFNVEGKSKHYRDAALSHLFIMNNVHYITQKIKGSPELREMIGDNYLRKLTGRFRQAATYYQRATWVKVLYCLRDEGLHTKGSFSSGVSRSALRERFKSFNALFEEVHRVQSQWLIPDTQLREELRISISEKLIPAYRSFLGRFRSHIESGKHPENYIKFSVEDLETGVLDLFEGLNATQHLRRRSQ
ncbi:PREDICTED: exocyst complex component EXO70A1 [Tarenaya hassleriana]|uniref:exocyst complex component EXO70A1 n=1 Tax=Tarenaya hassleriana TaxID=28532 RepID=UPI00053C981F|nr:PREDICTED: exocyst complex component EXO70A1 [Tarenaya hassleriana]